MSSYQHPNKPDQKNLMIAVILSAILIIGWQVLIETPKREKLAAWNIEQQKKERVLAQEQAKMPKAALPDDKFTAMPRENRIANAPRVRIQSNKVDGSFSRLGLRFDDLSLADYHTEVTKGSPEVTLLSPSGGEDTYFAQIGWIAAQNNVRVPDSNTFWQADNELLTPEQPVKLWWDNGQGLRFEVTVALDRFYMFNFSQRVVNNSGSSIQLMPYAFINRTYKSSGLHTYILHEGPLGVLDGSLSEIGYGDLEDEPTTYEDASGWFGITDKYWLTAFIPNETKFKSTFSYYESKGQPRYQAEYTAPVQTIAKGTSRVTTTRFFAGAKMIGLLDAYAEGTPEQPPIPLFDRAVDFGILYFLTKPMFLLLASFYAWVGNFGLAIILMTLLIKLAMFPLANKGYKATAAMRSLQPKMQELKEKHGDDRVKFQQEVMALYKKEKVNPASGCLPIFVQIPVFFALYKVLFVTIEMRHAPFMGWLVDLSAPDPSNLFTLFGLIPWTPPELMHLGLLPILMGFTMWLQFQLQPTPTDPMQARLFKFMPFIFTIMLARMPAGLVLYWTCSNSLSIIQQYIITRKYEIDHPRKQTKKEKKAAKKAKAEQEQG